ncbi:MAG: hypothetical protein AAF677_07755 [Pseudomonadota bacterium]
MRKIGGAHGRGGRDRGGRDRGGQDRGGHDWGAQGRGYYAAHGLDPDGNGVEAARRVAGRG